MTFFPELKTERLVLRTFEENDMEALFALLSDEQVNTFLPWFPLKTPAEAVHFYHQRFAPQALPPQAYCYAICLKTDRIPVGYVAVKGDDSHDFGYALLSRYWHQGITSEAALAVIEQLRRDQIPLISATHDILNPRSGSVMRRIGMTYRYTYQECVQPKNQLVTFRMYQLDLDGKQNPTYDRYWQVSDVHYIETENNQNL